MSEECEHGRLRRSCSECADKEEIAELKKDLMDFGMTIADLRQLNEELVESLSKVATQLPPGRPEVQRANELLARAARGEQE